ncbi:S41 family peptidase [soil metagenome]|jgi:carboxyl-terminal processing protease
MKQTAGTIFKSMLLIFIGVVIGTAMSDNDFTGQNFGFSLAGNNKLSKALALVKNNYVDTLNIDSIQGATVNDLLQGLDPHSMYLPPLQAESINERLEGGFNGIGLEYILLRDTLIISQIYAGGPAAAAGLKPGDRVINVNGKKFSGTHLTPDGVNKTFKGEKDSKILLAALSPGGTTLKQYPIKRGHVDLTSLDAAYMVSPEVGYIKISKFALTTDDDFREALSKLKVLGMKKLVLDIRDNGGGYLNTATALADEFLKKDRLIVYTQGAHEQRREYLATDSGEFQQGKLAVLINEYSASASEILAGALQDLDRAVIVGRRSFGKGLVQQQFPFSDGSAINLTVARYYTPSGRSIQKSYKAGVDNYRNELSERMRKGELFSEQNNLKDTSFKRPSPYRTLKGRKVFSGGGIMPDVFVPADSTKNTPLIQDITNNQLFTSFVVDRMEPTLKKYSSADIFIRQFEVDDNLYGQFILYCSKTLKEMDSHELLISKANIKKLLKANAAHFKWGDSAYYEVVNSNDLALKKAVEAIN